MNAKEIRHLLRERDGDDCWLCKEPMEFERLPNGQPSGKYASIDHIQRRHNGGGTTLTNLRLAHINCNVHRTRHPHIHVNVKRRLLLRQIRLDPIVYEAIAHALVGKGCLQRYEVLGEGGSRGLNLFDVFIAPANERVEDDIHD